MGHCDPFTPFSYPKIQQIDKCKKETYKFHHATWVYQKSYSYGLHLPGNDVHTSTGYLDSFLPFSQFFAQKIKIFKK